MILAAVLVALVLSPVPAHAHEDFRALLFTETAGFRHDSIDAGVAMFQQLAADEHFGLVHTEDSTIFNDTDLATFDVVIMFQTSKMVWDTEAQRTAMQTYVRGGGGIMAIHNATDMNVEQEFPWWDELVNAGAHMTAHAKGGQQATVKVLDKVHPSTAGLPDRWQRVDEWYNFSPGQRGKVHVLAQVDEKTYNPGGNAMGADHPISWCRDAEGGRVWATAMGHDAASYQDPLFRQHILGGAKTAAGVVEANCIATVDSAFEKVPLDTDTHAPTTLAVAPDGRVFYTELLGRLKVFNPRTNMTTVALDLPVYFGAEAGLVGLAMAPDFATTGHLYLYYGPPGTAQINRLSRFTLQGDTVNPTSEVTILEVPAERTFGPAHTGGYLKFGPDGNLYLSVGDDTAPGQSSGFTPIDERPGRSGLDAQRTSGNTNDLRGKILRITPKPEGGYTIPSGNMFPPGTAQTRPEIYAMGLRNPYRFTIGADGTLYVADYGPDSRTANPNRGPDGRVEWNIVRGPGFYGWPYCVADNVPYRDYDFATGASGPAFDCANPVNTSPNNTGLTDLPPAQAPEVWYGYGASAEFPELKTGGAAPMAGPVYEFDPNLASDTKFPAYYDGKPFFYEWSRGRLFTFSLDDQGRILKIDPFLASEKYLSPMDMAFGPDGSMYLLEWGSGSERDNPDSALYRIDHTQGNRRPVALATATPSSGHAPLEITFSSQGSSDPEGTNLSYAWTFGDGATSAEPSPTHTYAANGQYTAQLTVTDQGGKAGVTNVIVTVGNTAPSVAMRAPVDGGFFDFGDQVDLDLEVTDPEDGTVECAEVVVQPALGHDSHAHPLDPLTGCADRVTTEADEGHPDANIYNVIDVSYTDHGASGQPALTSRAKALLQPKHKQAEYFTRSSGIRVVERSDAQDGARVGGIDNGDWISFKPVNLRGIDKVALRVSSSGEGGTVELRAGATDGPLVASVPVPDTGGYSNYVSLPPVDVTDPGGTKELFLVFRTPAPGRYDLDALDFIGKGVSRNAAPHVVATATPVVGNSPLDVAFRATATDPEGDLPLSFAWDFGDGTTATGAQPRHTYGQAGTYAATVTVTDRAGRVKVTKVRVVVAPAVTPPVLCHRPGSDDFTGTALNRDIWTTVRPAEANYPVTGGALVLPTAPGDIAGQSAGPISFVGQPAPSGAWTATTLVDIETTESAQQAGILLWANDNNYVLVGPESRGAPRLQFGSERNGNRTTRFMLAPSDQTRYHLRLESNGTVVRAYTSVDGRQWTAFDGTFPLPAGNLTVGPYALRGNTPAPVIDTRFQYFYLSGTPAGEVNPDDEFTGTRLDGCRWTEIANPAGPRVENGELHVDDNVLLHGAPEGDWVAETRVLATGQDAGLVVSDHVRLSVVPGRRAELVSGVDSRSVPLTGTGWWHLRLAKTGDSYAGWVSADGTTWRSVGDPVTNAAPARKVGLRAAGPARFDWYHFDRVDRTPPVTTATVDPAQPDGDNGWWRTPPRITLAAADGTGFGVARTEYRIDAGDWTPYAAPFLMRDGVHTVQYRSVDQAGNTEEAKSVPVKVDATAPAPKVTGVRAGTSYGDGTDLSLSFSGTDVTSGIASVTGSMAEMVPLHLLDLGEHTLFVTAVDKAGNTAVIAVTFTVTTSFTDVTTLIDRFHTDGTLDRATASLLTREADQARRHVRRDQLTQAEAALNRLAQHVERTVTDPIARRVLLRDAQALLDNLTA